VGATARILTSTVIWVVAVFSPCEPHMAHAQPEPTASRGGSLPTATLRLTALCEAASAMPSAFEIALSLPLEGRPAFRLDDNVFGSHGMGELVSHAEAVDGKGPLPLVRRVLSDPARGKVLELEGTRAAVGMVTFRYRARSVATIENGARHGLRHDLTGIGGLGAYFLVLPESSRVHRVRVAWGRPTCASAHGPERREEMRALSSFGLGPGPSETTGVLDTLRGAAFFVGRPKVISVDDGAVRVRSVWFGEPSFDLGAATTWAARALAAERAFFADEDPAPYFLFVRVLPALGGRANGTGQTSSLLTAIGPQTAFGLALRRNMAHEMLHRWIGIGLRLAGPEGSNFWFTEGFTVHYAALLMLRAGLMSPDEFLAELNNIATRYFANEHASATNEEIRRAFFENDALSVVPYARGALYAAELDAAIRRASAGRRSLDDLIRALYRRARSGPGVRELPVAAFREAVHGELGRPGVDRFDAVIVRGARAEPPSDAFGPCFVRMPRSFAQFELGFNERGSLAEPRAIRGLVADSAAARAGLVEGDEIVSVDSSFLVPDKEAVVTVRRGGQRVVVRYLPARPGPKRDGFEWVRASGVPDDQCVASTPPRGP